MKTYISILALVALPACMGGGGGGGVDTTPGAPDVTSNTQLGTQLNNARTSGLSALTYHSGVGQIAQNHADDMFDRDYLSIYDAGTTGFAGLRGERDMGDDLNDANLRWQEIVQMVAEGDQTVVQVFTEFQNRDRGEVEGSFNEELATALDEEDFEFFGLGKSGTGPNQKWAMLIVHPNSDWSDR